MSVFAGRSAAVLSPPQYFLKSWPLFKSSAPQRGALPTAEVSMMVESDILPRLMQAHPSAERRSESPARQPTLRLVRADNGAVEAFAALVFQRSTEPMTASIESMLRAGASATAIYDDVLAPAARLLVELWDRDEASYTEVTIGLGRLQQCVRDLDGDSPYDGADDPCSKSIFLSPRPGEQQTFGFYLIEELFRWSGWRTWIETASTQAAMNACLRSEWFDALCLSVTRENQIEEVRGAVDAARRASCNRDLFVLVNGRPFEGRPELVASVGADAAASNGAEALHIADTAIRRPSIE